MTNKKILNKINNGLPEGYRLLYASKMGSHLYGTNSPTSDLDVKFIFLPSVNDCLLGVDSKNINMNTSNDKDKNTSDDVDIQGWSIQFFVDLLRKSDTNAIDLLYSYTNENCIIYMSKAIKDQMFDYPTEYFDVSNMRGLLGYIVSQSEKYGLKGSRFSKFLEIKEAVDKYKEYEWYNQDLHLRDIYHDLILEVGDDLYCKFEKTEDNRDAIRLCGKVHMLDITMLEFMRRIDNEMARYGERTKASLDGSDWKALSHAYRCIIQALELLLYGSLTFPLAHRDVIKNIKSGETERETVDKMISTGLESVSNLMHEMTPNPVNVKNTRKFILDLYSYGEI